MSALPILLERWQSLTPEQRDEVLQIHIPPEQVEFAGSIERAVAACEAGIPLEVAGLAILQVQRVVGFVVLSRGSKLPSWAPPDSAALTAMRIDSREQGKGLGKAALALTLSWLRRHWSDTATLALCVDEQNQAGRRAYAAAGFSDYTEPKPGRIGVVHYLSRSLQSAGEA